MRVSINTVNKALSDKGIKMSLARGKGYFYFYGPDADLLATQGVYVPRLNDLTLDQWVEEALSKTKDLEG